MAWARWLQHEVCASGAPGRGGVGRWAAEGVTDLITLQRGDEVAGWLAAEVGALAGGMRWHRLPLSGKRLGAAQDRGSLEALVQWARGMALMERESARVVVHCSAGLHRTGVALYMMFRAVGLSQEEALAHIAQTRALTAQELCRQSKHQGRLIDLAEACFVALP
jgi:hypothetical protein